MLIDKEEQLKALESIADGDKNMIDVLIAELKNNKTKSRGFWYCY